jgi:hypothetical protein
VREHKIGHLSATEMARMIGPERSLWQYLMLHLSEFALRKSDACGLEMGASKA